MRTASLVNYSGFRFLRNCINGLLQLPSTFSIPFSLQSSFHILTLMDSHKNSTSSFSVFAPSKHSHGRGRGFNARGNRERSSSLGGGSEKDKIDALGRLLVRILRHMASELNLKMRSDGFVKVQDLLKLHLKTFANIPLKLHTVDDMKEAVRKDNKQRLSLLEESGELWVRANQGHSIKMVETESLLKPIISADEVPVCVHGTYKKDMQSILEQGLKRMRRLHVHFSCGLPTDGGVISGMRRDVNMLIFLDVKKALQGARKVWDVLSCPLINLGVKFLPIHPKVERWVLLFLSFVITCTFVLSPIYLEQVNLLHHIIDI
ncbi:unnamed protein product [Cuscuta europaea]|uniref:2'-phosphotransferase n=1 Tax=Cuscuta europaea TaxID=41803 RepID=A0A9P0Z197_CUSEU|nr:unnamed protein product [Cuscuta europaea]